MKGWSYLFSAFFCWLLICRFRGFGSCDFLSLVVRLVFIRARLVVCAIHYEVAPHEWLVMQNLDGTLCLINILHLDKAEAFGAMRMLVVDDFDLANGANPFEKVFQRAFIGII